MFEDRRNRYLLGVGAFLLGLLAAISGLLLSMVRGGPRVEEDGARVRSFPADGQEAAASRHRIVPEREPLMNVDVATRDAQTQPGGDISNARYGPGAMAAAPARPVEHEHGVLLAQQGDVAIYRERGRGWRFMQWAGWAAAAAGLFLLASPWIFAYWRDPIASWTSVALGGAIAIVGALEYVLPNAAVWERAINNYVPYESNWQYWVLFLLGGLTFFAPWVLVFVATYQAFWVMVGVGMFVMLAAGIRMFDMRVDYPLV